MAIVNEPSDPRYAGATMKRKYQVARGLHAEFLYIPDDLVAVRCIWHPDQPTDLAGQALRRYRRARLDFAKSVQERIGRPVVVLDMPHVTLNALRRLALAMCEPRGHA